MWPKEEKSARIKRMEINHNHHLRYAFWLKLAIVVAPLLVLVISVNNNFILTNTVSFLYAPGSRATVVGLEDPSSVLRTASTTIPWRIFADILPVSVRLPRIIESVRVKARLSLSTQPTVWFTATGNAEGGDMTSLYCSSLLNELTWKSVTSDHQTIWQRPDQQTKETTIIDGKSITISPRRVRQYTSLEEFRANPPDLQKVATIGIDRMALSKVNSYRPATKPITLDHTIRGSQSIYTYASGETISLSFDMIDMNRTKGKSGLAIRIGRADQLTDRNRRWLVTKTVGDDGDVRGDRKRKPPRHVTISLPKAASGMYRIEIATTNDILLTRLTSSQHYFAFERQLFLADGPAYFVGANFSDVNVQTDGSRVSFTPYHAEGAQTIMVDNKKIQLKTAREDYSSNDLRGVTTIKIAKGDVLITSTGLINMDPASMLPSGTAEIDPVANPDLSAYDYVMAEYLVPKDKKTITIDETYKVSDLKLSAKKQLQFSLAFPGLRTNDYLIGLQDIRVTLYRGPLPWSKIWNRLTHWKI